MSQNSKIEWTDATWNPIRGCSKVSPGCKYCYAETFAERFRGVAGHPYERGFDLRIVPERLSDPLHWKTHKTIFVNSMSDLFHEKVPDDYIVSIVKVMEMANWHTFQVLTKRAQRMKKMLQTKLKFASKLENIWWGVSVEDRKYGVPRIDCLREINVPIRFLSIEPLLEDLGKINLTKIQWVIVGGESGTHARRMEKSWVESLRKQCSNARIPFFFKQWGGFPKHKKGRKLNGRTYNASPKKTIKPLPDNITRKAMIDVISKNKYLRSIL